MPHSGGFRNTGCKRALDNNALSLVYSIQWLALPAGYVPHHSPSPVVAALEATRAWFDVPYFLGGQQGTILVELEEAEIGKHGELGSSMNGQQDSTSVASAAVMMECNSAVALSNSQAASKHLPVHGAELHQLLACTTRAAMGEPQEGTA
jgi:hypothetical protein